MKEEKERAAQPMLITSRAGGHSTSHHTNISAVIVPCHGARCIAQMAIGTSGKDVCRDG